MGRPHLLCVASLALLCRHAYSQCSTATLYSGICVPGYTVALPSTLGTCDRVAVPQDNGSVLDPGNAGNTGGDGDPGNVADPDNALSLSQAPDLGDAASATGLSIYTVPESKTLTRPPEVVSSLDPRNGNGVPDPVASTASPSTSRNPVSPATDAPEIESSTSTSGGSPTTSTVQSSSQFIDSIALTVPSSLLVSPTLVVSASITQTATPPFRVSTTITNTSQFLIYGPDGLFFNRLGELQSDCQTSTSWAVNDGILSPSDDLNSIISVDVGVPFGPIDTSNPGLAIQQNWVISGNNLTWSSSVFKNNPVIICEGPFDLVGYYNQLPAYDCNSVQLKALNPSDCPQYYGDTGGAPVVLSNSNGLVTVTASGPLATSALTSALTTVPDVLKPSSLQFAQTASPSA